MYRNDLAAAHAENEILRRRVAQLESGTAGEVNDYLLELASRGRAVRDKQSKRAARKRRRSQLEAESAQRKRQRADRRARKKRLSRACARFNVRAGAWFPVVTMPTLALCLMPAFIFSGIFRMIALPIVGLAILWPLIALGLDAAINRNSVAREKRWLESRPFPIDGHFERLEEERFPEPTELRVAFKGRAPKSSIVSDIAAGLAARRGGLSRWMLEASAVSGDGTTLRIGARFADTWRGRHREYRLWLRGVVDVLELLHGDFPIASARVSADS